MELKDLQARLRDPDQWVRVETLRILAMVEETGALRDIEWVYKNDPEPGVRQVAQWAGRIVYAALKQAKTATSSQQTLLPESSREEMLLSSLIDKDSRTYHAMQAQLLEHELTRTIQQPTQPRPAAETRLPVPVQPPEEVPLDLLQLLDDGLSDDFFRD